MTDPLRLAEEIEEMVEYADSTGTCAIGGMHLIAHDGRLIAAALRLAEANHDLNEHWSARPERSGLGEWIARRESLRERMRDAEAAYRAARGRA